MASYLKLLRDAIAADLTACPFLGGRGVPVITRQVGDIEAAIEQALTGGELNRCLVVFTPVIKKVQNGAKGPHYDKIFCRVKCLENPLLNQSDQDAEILAELVFQWLHLHAYPLPGATNNPLLAAEPATEDEGLHGDGNQREIDCLFETSGGLAEIPRR